MKIRKDKNVVLEDSALNNLGRRRRSAARRYNIRVFLVRWIPVFVFCFIVRNWLLLLVVSSLYYIFSTIFCDHRFIRHFDPVISVWFGVPGSGKTSVAAWLAAGSIKSHYRVLSNVEIKNTYRLYEEDLGTVDMSFGGEGCHVIYDEASLEGLDNRLHANFAKSNKPKYFSLHRHMHNRVDVFSQAYDIDKRVRDRAGSSRMFHLKRFPIKGFVYYRRIKKILFINKEDKQIVDGFEYSGLPRICFTRPVWHSFDTKDLSLCPKNQKEWKLWNEEDPAIM